ncbi:MAG: hypothetical protein ABIQ55_11630 [Gemmatimonadaceae bacterium]
MPRIDPLLTALLSNRAESVGLSDGDIAHLVKERHNRPRGFLSFLTYGDIRPLPLYPQCCHINL